MLEVIIPDQDFEVYDQESETFIQVKVKKTKLQLEHSLISLRKWEQMYHVPFIGKRDKSRGELISYIRCMTLNGPIDPEVYKWIPPNIVEKVVKYIEDPATATWFADNKDLIGGQKTKDEVITAEIIYYWMVTLNIPPEYQKWHLNSLLTLIRVVSIKNSAPKKKDAATLARERAALNKKRRAELNSTG